jgi:hypothetical protein
MTHHCSQRTFVAFLLAVGVAAMAVGCGGGPEFTQEQASVLIGEQWPDRELQMRNAFVDDQGRGVAAALFDGEPWEFYFHPTDEGGWELEAVSVDGGFYYLRDLEQISATMLQMGEAASALEAYKAANGSYPEGDSPQALAPLIPDFLAEETQRHDAWEQDFLYESNGVDYTLTSLGADGEEGTRDDIILHSGEFIGTGGQGR